MDTAIVYKCRALFTHLLTGPEWVLSRESLDAYRQYNIDIPEFGPWAWWDTSIFDNYRKGEVVMYIDDPLAFLGAIPGEEGAYLLALYTAHLMGSGEPCP